VPRGAAVQPQGRSRERCQKRADSLDTVLVFLYWRERNRKAVFFSCMRAFCFPAKCLSPVYPIRVQAGRRRVAGSLASFARPPPPPWRLAHFLKPCGAAPRNSNIKAPYAAVPSPILSLFPLLCFVCIFLSEWSVFGSRGAVAIGRPPVKCSACILRDVIIKTYAPRLRVQR
jgi:hypothetical protein